MSFEPDQLVMCTHNGHGRGTVQRVGGVLFSEPCCIKLRAGTLLIVQRSTLITGGPEPIWWVKFDRLPQEWVGDGRFCPLLVRVKRKASRNEWR